MMFKKFIRESNKDKYIIFLYYGIIKNITFVYFYNVYVLYIVFFSGIYRALCLCNIRCVDFFVTIIF